MPKHSALVIEVLKNSTNRLHSLPSQRGLMPVCPPSEKLFLMSCLNVTSFKLCLLSPIFLPCTAVKSPAPSIAPHRCWGAAPTSHLFLRPKEPKPSPTRQVLQPVCRLGSALLNVLQVFLMLGVVLNRHGMKNAVQH